MTPAATPVLVRSFSIGEFNLTIEAVRVPIDTADDVKEFDVWCTWVPYEPVRYADAEIEAAFITARDRFQQELAEQLGRRIVPIPGVPRA